MAWTIYPQFKLKQHNGNGIDLDAASGLKLAILTNSYVPSGSDALFSAISANEVSGSNYTAGGSTLASTTVTEASGTVTFDSADVTFSQHASGFTNGRYAVIYEVSSSKLVCRENFGSDKGNVAGDLVLQMDAAGIFTVS